MPDQGTKTALTYDTTWRCTHCKASGVVSIPTSEACDTLWDTAVGQHRSASYDCHAARGTAGLALQPATPQGAIA